MIKGKKVELRPVSKDDFRKTYDWRNDEEVSKWATGSDAFYEPVPAERLDDVFDKTYKEFDLNVENVFSIYTLDDEPMLIGRCDYRDVHQVSRRCDIGITIGEKDYWGKGYGTDALRTLINFLFTKMNLKRIQLDTWSGNERAIRSYKKLGFVVEGHLRNNEFVEGEYWDTIIMGLLKEEFICNP